MADKRTTPEAPEGAPQAAPERSRRTKRAAPTIELTATEVPPPQQAAAPQPDPPPAAEEPAPGKTAAAETQPARTGVTFGVAALTGGAAGLAGALLVLLGLYVAGLVHPATSTTTTTQAADSKAIDALAQRVGALETEIKNLPPGDAGVAARLAAAESAMKSLGVALAALSRRNDDIAANADQARERADAAQKAIAELRASVQDAAKTSSAGITPAELEALQSRIAALEQSTKLARDDIAKASSADVAARLALSAASLRDAVTSGAPFSAELTQAKVLGADDKILAPLAPFAATGVPAAPALGHELNALLPTMIKNADAAPQGGFLDRLQANAGRLVRIRPVSAPPGDEPSAVLARLEIDAAKADIAAALADLGRLDEATRAPAQGWIEKAQARQAALEAAHNFAADTARALGPKAAAQ
jgi:hypothetical protein